MRILAIDHVQLAIPPGEEETSRRFYIDQLGFSEVPKPAALAARGGVWLRADDVVLHLGVETDFRPALKAHPAFLIEGLDALLSRLQAAGYPIDTTQPPLEGYRRAHIFDPSGNRIELMEKL